MKNQTNEKEIAKVAFGDLANSYGNSHFTEFFKQNVANLPQTKTLTDHIGMLEKNLAGPNPGLAAHLAEEYEKDVQMLTGKYQAELDVELTPEVMKKLLIRALVSNEAKMLYEKKIGAIRDAGISGELAKMSAVMIDEGIVTSGDMWADLLKFRLAKEGKINTVNMEPMLNSIFTVFNSRIALVPSSEDYKPKKGEIFTPRGIKRFLSNIFPTGSESFNEIKPAVVYPAGVKMSITAEEVKTWMLMQNGTDQLQMISPTDLAAPGTLLARLGTATVVGKNADSTAYSWDFTPTKAITVIKYGLMYPKMVLAPERLATTVAGVYAMHKGINPVGARTLQSTLDVAFDFVQGRLSSFMDLSIIEWVKSLLPKSTPKTGA